MKRIVLALVALCLIATGANSYWQSRLQVAIGGVPPSACSPVACPLDVPGYTSAYGYWGLRCSSFAYSGFAAEIRDDGTNAIQTLLSCSGGALSQTVNPLSTTCAIACSVHILYDQVGAQPMDVPSGNVILLQGGDGLGTNLTMKCNGSRLTTTSNATALAQPFTLSLVTKLDSFTGNGDSFSNGDPVQMQASAANQILMYAGTVQTFTSVTDGQWASIQAVFAGGSSTMNVANASLNPTGVPSSAVNAGSNGIGNSELLGICDRTSGGLSWNGSILEILAIPGAVSAPNQATQVSNQRAYGGF